jgi:hypothetical protein
VTLKRKGHINSYEDVGLLLLLGDMCYVHRTALDDRCHGLLAWARSTAAAVRLGDRKGGNSID